MNGEPYGDYSPHEDVDEEKIFLVTFGGDINRETLSDQKFPIDISVVELK